VLLVYPRTAAAAVARLGVQDRGEGPAPSTRLAVQRFESASGGPAGNVSWCGSRPAHLGLPIRSTSRSARSWLRPGAAGPRRRPRSLADHPGTPWCALAEAPSRRQRRGRSSHWARRPAEAAAASAPGLRACSNRVPTRRPSRIPARLPPRAGGRPPPGTQHPPAGSFHGVHRAGNFIRFPLASPRSAAGSRSHAPRCPGKARRRSARSRPARHPHPGLPLDFSRCFVPAAGRPIILTDSAAHPPSRANRGEPSACTPDGTAAASRAPRPARRRRPLPAARAPEPLPPVRWPHGTGARAELLPPVSSVAGVRRVSGPSLSWPRPTLPSSFQQPHRRRHSRPSRRRGHPLPWPRPRQGAAGPVDQVGPPRVSAR